MMREESTMALIDEIKEGKSTTVEFSENIPGNNFMVQTAIAFANTDGGKLFFGVSDTNEILGLPNNINIIDTQRRITRLIEKSCVPTIKFKIHTVSIDRKHILVLEVFEGEEKPYYWENKGEDEGIYIRKNKDNVQTDQL
jgi:ATP-dependent DNA helicase RecG